MFRKRVLAKSGDHLNIYNKKKKKKNKEFNEPNLEGHHADIVNRLLRVKPVGPTTDNSYVPR